MSPTPPPPRRPQRAIRLTEKLTNPDNVGEHNEYMLNSIAASRQHVPPIIQPSSQDAQSLSSSVATTPTASMAPLSVSLSGETQDAEDNPILTAPATSPPPSSPILISSSSSESEAGSTDHEDKDCSSDEELRLSKKSKKRKQGPKKKTKGTPNFIYILFDLRLILPSNSTQKATQDIERFTRSR